MTLRLRVLILGSLASLIASACCVASLLLLRDWIGSAASLVVVAVVPTAIGILAALASARLVEEQIHERFSAIDNHDPSVEPPARLRLIDHEVEEMVVEVQRELCRSRNSETNTDEIDRLARAFWTAIHGKSGPTNPIPDTGRCVAGLFDLFRQTAETLVRYASNLEESNERMASGAIDQSDTVSRTATTVEALSDKIDRISENAENATQACERSRLEARRSLEQVHQVIEGMDRLRAQIEIDGRKARRLGDRSIEIGTIVELIRGISSRTDMLALNATIESVRAGEHGRGFAVVAEEIRKLAERTAAATREISTLVEAIQTDTNESIRAMSEEQTQVEQEAQRIRETGAALERISQVAESSARLVEGISKSSNDQVLAAQELVRAMQRISDVSNITLERTSQSRDSIRGLSQWCERLAPLVSIELKRPLSNGSSADWKTHATSPASPPRPRGKATSELAS